MMEGIFELDATEQVFTHKDENNNYTTFLVDRMVIHAFENPKADGIEYVRINIEEAHALHLKQNSGIEPHRIDRLVEPYLSLPMVGIMWEDGTFTIVDGAHRYVRMYNDGIKDAKVILYRYPAWKQFVVPDIITNVMVGLGCMERESGIK